MNLAGDAVECTEEGGVAVNVAFEDEGDGRTLARSEVSDAGMNEEQRARLFRSFSRADHSPLRRHRPRRSRPSRASPLVFEPGDALIAYSNGFFNAFAQEPSPNELADILDGAFGAEEMVDLILEVARLEELPRNGLTVMALYRKP